MKKILTVLLSLIILLSMSVCARAEGGYDYTTDTGTTVWSAFAESKSALAAGIVFAAILALVLIFRKKLKKKLNNSTAKHMTAAFIIFFSVCGTACLALTLATDGEAWLDMMHGETLGPYSMTQFSDYAETARNAGSRLFYKSAERFSPMALLLYFIIAQFLPSNLILSESTSSYMLMLKNQTVILLYLFLVLFTTVLLYRMNRSVLRRNGLRAQDELIAFLAVVSYPSVYCIELGNTAGLSIVLTMFFILFMDSEKRLLRELSLIAIGFSAAITPYTILFALLILKDKSKNSIIPFVKAAGYFIVLFILPAFFTGFGNMLDYVKSFLSVSADGFTAGNMSVANLLVFFGVKSKAALYAVMLLTELIAAVCVFLLPSSWQKCAAIVYIILNFYGISEPTLLIFVFIPLAFLMAEKRHKASDWSYLTAFSFLVTPLPAWYYFDKKYFALFLEEFNLEYIPAANSLFSLAATQMIFILIVSQTAATIIKKSDSRC